MSDHARSDPFALGGRDDDEAILSLFRQWIAGTRAAQALDDNSPDGDEITAANDRLHGLIGEINALPAQGVVGLVIKSYLALHWEYGNFESGTDTAGLRSLGPKTIGLGPAQSIMAFLRDAARFVTEIAPLLPSPEDDAEPQDEEQPLALRERVAAIVAEFAVPLPEGSAGLAESLRRLVEIRARFQALDKEFAIDSETEEQEIIPHRDPLECRFEDYLVETQPQTLADSATILHFILDHGGLDNTAVTATAIENVLAMIEREAREGGAA